MVRGEIYRVRLQPRSGSEQTGMRPCLLISHDSFNATGSWHSLTVLPLTSSVRWRRPSRTTVLLEKGEANLPKESAVLAHQITTVDRSKLSPSPIGRLGGDRMSQVEQALRNYLDLS